MRGIAGMSFLVAMAVPAAADAQSVVMRRPVPSLAGAGSAPSATPTPAPAPVLPHSWVVGEWSDVSACSLDSTGTRSVRCQRFDGVVAPDASCGAGRPVAERQGPVLDGCRIDWVSGAWGQYDTTCGDAAYRDRTVTCAILVPGGTDVPTDASQCTSPRPVDREGPTLNHAGCSYAWETTDWGGWSSHCSDAAVRTRTVTCGRSDGGKVDDALCTSAKPDPSETGAIHDACSYSLTSQFRDPKEFVFTSAVGPMTMMSAGRWQAGSYYYAGAYDTGGNVMFHPEDGGVEVGASFVAPRAGTFRFRGRFFGAHNCGDGIVAKFDGRSQVVFQSEAAFDFERSMSAGQSEPFLLNSNENQSCDSTFLDLEVTQR